MTKVLPERKRSRRNRLTLTAGVALLIFGVVLSALFALTLIALILHQAGIWSFSRPTEGDSYGPFFSFFALIIFFVLPGTALATYFANKVLKPIHRIIEATHQVADGNFKVEVEARGIGELVELSNEFNRMTHELASLETLRQDFVNNFSHELKTPIVSIRGFALLLRDGNLSDTEKQEYLDIIIAESQRLTELSTNVLNLSKYENTEIIRDKNTFCLDEQIRRILVLLEPKWSAKNIHLEVALAKLSISSNEDLLDQIWINLLDNAIKFSEVDGFIRVSLEERDGQVVFCVSDNGPGISPEAQEHIFERFYQDDSSHNRSGNGLGLAIVRRITQLSGGQIFVQSNPGKGSSFTVTLPLGSID